MLAKTINACRAYSQVIVSQHWVEELLDERWLFGLSMRQSLWNTYGQSPSSLVPGKQQPSDNKKVISARSIEQAASSGFASQIDELLNGEPRSFATRLIRSIFIFSIIFVADKREPSQKRMARVEHLVIGTFLVLLVLVCTLSSELSPATPSFLR